MQISAKTNKKLNKTQCKIVLAFNFLFIINVNYSMQISTKANYSKATAMNKWRLSSEHHNVTFHLVTLGDM